MASNERMHSYTTEREYSIMTSNRYREELKRRNSGTIQFDHMAHRPYGFGEPVTRED